MAVCPGDVFVVESLVCEASVEDPHETVPERFALGFLEALECGKMRAMSEETTTGKPTTRRYTKDEKDQAVRLVFELRRDLEHEPGHRGEDCRPVGVRHRVPT